MVVMKKIANEKIVVLSDIHGNYIAFQKCLEFPTRKKRWNSYIACRRDFPWNGIGQGNGALQG